MNPVELTLAVGSSVAGLGGLAGLAALLQYRATSKNAATAKAVEDSSDVTVNLQKGQESFIATLQRENENWRNQVDELHRIVDQLRKEIEQLRAELATERRAREAADARASAEQTARTRLGYRDTPDEQEIRASGDAAEQRAHDHSDELDS